MNHHEQPPAQYDEPEFIASIEAEQSVLGCLLRAPEKLDELELVEDDFAIGSHRTIFAAILRLVQYGLPVDAITVHDLLGEQNEADAVGGLAYLGELAGSTATAANVRHYARIVREKSLARQLSVAGVELQAMAANAEGESIDVRIERGIGLLQALTRQVRGNEPVPLIDALRDGIEEVQSRLENPGALTGTDTGLKALNDALMGYQSSDLIIVAGRPSMGKTSLVMQGAETAAAAGKRVLVFSLEMSRKQLAIRMAAGRAGIPINHVLHGTMSGDEMALLSAATGSIAGWPLHIDDTGGLTIEQIRARAKRHAVRHGLDLIVVDHLGLIKLPGRANKASELGDVTAELKSLAKTVGVPVVLAVQLNRESAKGGHVRRPTMTDIRDSGRIEEDADVVLLLHRPGYYDAGANPTEAEILVEKQRMGERGLVLQVGWRAPLSRFANQSDNWLPPAKPAARYSGYENDL